MSPSQTAAGLDIGAVQAALAADGIDGWLLYDFRGLNPLASDVTGVPSTTAAEALLASLCCSLCFLSFFFFFFFLPRPASASDSLQ